MGAVSPTRLALGLRVTPEEHRIVQEAATRQHRSLNSFIVTAALDAARSGKKKPKRSVQEVRRIVRAAQREIAAANPGGRDLFS